MIFKATLTNHDYVEMRLHAPDLCYDFDQWLISEDLAWACIYEMMFCEGFVQYLGYHRNPTPDSSGQGLHLHARCPTPPPNPNFAAYDGICSIPMRTHTPSTPPPRIPMRYFIEP